MTHFIFRITYALEFNYIYHFPSVQKYTSMFSYKRKFNSSLLDVNF